MRVSVEGIDFDDCNISDEGNVWTQVCEKCQVKVKRILGTDVLDDVGYGVCGVEGCHEEDSDNTYYLDIPTEKITFADTSDSNLLILPKGIIGIEKVKAYFIKSSPSKGRGLFLLESSCGIRFPVMSVELARKMFPEKALLLNGEYYLAYTGKNENLTVNLKAPLVCMNGLYYQMVCDIDELGINEPIELIAN